MSKGILQDTAGSHHILTRKKKLQVQSRILEKKLQMEFTRVGSWATRVVSYENFLGMRRSREGFKFFEPLRSEYEENSFRKN